MNARTRKARAELDRFFNEGTLRNKLESFEPRMSTDANELVMLLVSRYTSLKDEEEADDMLDGIQLD